MQVAQYVSNSSDEEILTENNEINRKRTEHWVREDVSDNTIVVPATP